MSTEPPPAAPAKDGAAAAPPPETKDTPPTPPTSPAAGAGARYQEIIDKLRGRVDVTGKALGALGTTAATAVGLAKIGDLFPIDNELCNRVWLGAALAGFFTAAISVLYLATRLSGVSRPVFMRTDVDDMERTGDVEPDEKAGVRSIFERWAHLNGVNSLAAYEAQGVRIRRSARWTSDDAERKRREDLASEIESDIRSAFGLAALRIVRHRTAHAVTGKGAWAAYVCFVLGVIAFALGTDYVSSERTERVAIAKSCGEARKAGATGAELPPVCSDDGRPKAAKPAAQKPSAAQQRRALAPGLVTSLRDCEAAVAAGPLTADACEPIRAAAASSLK